MIKGLLKKLCIFGLIALPGLFLNFSSADWVSVEFELPNSFIWGNSLNFVLKDLNFSNNEHKWLHIIDNGIQNNIYYVFWNNGRLYLYGYYSYSDSITQGYFYRFCRTIGTGYCDGGTEEIANEFYNLTDYNFTYFIGAFHAQTSYPKFCFYNQSNNFSYCTSVYYYDYSLLTGSLNIPSGTSDFTLYAQRSPFSSQSNVPIQTGPGINDYTYIQVNSGDVVDYFESQRNYNVNLCYVGTRDLSGNYEDRLTYYEGTGYTIFDAYSKLYNKSSFKLSEVGTFLNVQFVNFGSWFMGRNRDLSGNVIYNMIDNFDGTTSLDYGPGLTNPFLGNKAVFYFIGSTVWDSHIDEPDGERLAYYCYNRLTSYTNISGSTGYNIQDDHNNAYDEWVAVYKRNSSNYNNQFSGSDIIVSQSWDGTPLDYFDVESEGDDIEDLDFLGYFNKSFTRFKSVFEGLDISDLALGQLPSYIVAFLLAIIFFRFLRK